MPKLIVVTREGDEIALQGAAGMSVMEVIRDGGIDDLAAICGGCCSCATCHVHADPAYLDRLSPIGGDEDDLLDATIDRDFASRLSCQLVFGPDLDGMTVRIAAES